MRSELRAKEEVFDANLARCIASTDTRLLVPPEALKAGRAPPHPGRLLRSGDAKVAEAPSTVKYLRRRAGR